MSARNWDSEEDREEGRIARESSYGRSVNLAGYSRDLVKLCDDEDDDYDDKIYPSVMIMIMIMKCCFISSL